jgi:hypothetical protein
LTLTALSDARVLSRKHISKDVAAMEKRLNYNRRRSVAFPLLSNLQTIPIPIREVL